MATEPSGPPPGDTVGTDPPDEAPAHTGRTFDDAQGAQAWQRAATRATIDVGTDVMTWPIAR